MGRPHTARLAVAAGLAVLLAAARAPAQQPATSGPAAGAEADAAATGAEAARDDAAAAPDPEERARPRLLHLANGGVLRATARRDGDRWLWRRDGTWVALPAGAVTAVRVASDVEGEARRRRVAARRGGPDAQVEAAGWMAREGLLTEAFAELDDVLAADPDHAGARALLAGPALAMSLPAPSAEPPTLDAFLAFCGRLSPALREQAVARLSELTVGDAVRERLVADLRAPESGRRTFAALALRRLFPSRPSGELVRRALLDRDARVREQASLAVRDAGDARLLDPFVSVLGSDSTLVRTHAAQALATVGSPAAVAPLVTHLLALREGGGAATPRGSIFVGRQIAYVQDFDSEVAQNAAIADPVIGTIQEGATLDVEVLGVGGASVAAERRALHAALEQLTGARPGSSTAAWRRWWDEHRDEYPAWRPTGSGAAATATTGGPAAREGDAPHRDW